MYRARSTGKDTLLLSTGARKWAVGDYLCFTYPTGSVECGSVTAVGKDGARVKLDQPKKKGTGDTAYVYVEKKQRETASVSSEVYQTLPLVAIDPEISYFQLAAHDKTNNSDATISSSLTFGAALTLSPWHGRRLQPFLAGKVMTVGFAASPGTTFTSSPMLFSGGLGLGFHPLEGDDRLFVSLSGGITQEFYLAAAKVGVLGVQTATAPGGAFQVSYALLVVPFRLALEGGASAILAKASSSLSTSTAFGYSVGLSGTWTTQSFRVQPAVVVSRLQSASTAVDQSRTAFGLRLGVGWVP